jgi:hypothetical protein
MSDHGNQFTQRRVGSADSLTNFLGALSDLWGKGLSAWQMMAGGSFAGADRRGYPADTSYAAAMGPMAEMAGSMDAMFPNASGKESVAQAGQAAASQFADLSPAMAQACMVAAASTLRYWRALAELHGRHQASLMQAFADRATGHATASPEECRVLADGLRAFLREIGDAAEQEARRLQRELEEVSESIARTADKATSPPQPLEQPRRRPHRWKA